MQRDVFYYIEPISFYVAITFIVAISLLDLKKESNKLLLTIVSVCLITEITTLILVLNNKKIDLVYSISMLIHGSLWLLLILRQIKKGKAVGVLLTAFILFGLINLFFIEGLDNCNFNTFIVSALLYIVIFIYESFRQLKNENFSFFLSNNYLLLFIPILFFFGFSFVFGFKSDELAETIILGKVQLFDFIAYFANISYYTLINIYIYREKRLRNAG